MRLTTNQTKRMKRKINSQMISVIPLTLDNGTSDLFLFQLKNNIGTLVEILNYGASLVSFVAPDKNGHFGNIILCYHDYTDYLHDTFYLGSTIGRFANRIANGKFNLNGKEISVEKNDGKNSNHGGFSGFNSRFFSHKIEEDKLILSCESEDNDGGFPGNIRFSVTYSLSADNRLSIDYHVISDKDTVFNPTNHAYFNLSGGKDDIILDHQLKIFANQYLKTNDEFIPTGEILPVMKKTAFDFRSFRNISVMMSLKNEIINGFNTYFISDSEVDMKHLAILKSEVTGRVLNVYSTMPGVQIYTGDYLSEPFQPFEGICLEAQFYPDGPNHSDFKTLRLEKNRVYCQKIIYEVGIETSEN